MKHKWKYMDRAKRVDLEIIIFFVLLFAVFLIRGILSRPQESSSEAAPAASVSYMDYNGRNIGILTGTNMEQESFHYYPEPHL